MLDTPSQHQRAVAQVCGDFQLSFGPYRCRRSLLIWPWLVSRVLPVPSV